MFHFQAHFQLSTAITPQIAKASNVLSTLFSPAVFLMTLLLSAIALFYDRWKIFHSILLFNQIWFFLLWRSNLSLCLWYITRKLSVILLSVGTCSQRSEILFCPHCSHNWTITSAIFLSSLVSRHSYRNIIDFSWHLQSMSICLVMAVNICFDAALDPAEQWSPHEPQFSISEEHLLVSVCTNTAF